MEQSEHAYDFAMPTGAHILAAEALPLQLLELVNCGKPRANGSVTLRIAPVPLSSTLAELVDPTGPLHRRYVNECIIEHDYLALHLSKYPISCRCIHMLTDSIAIVCRLEPAIFHTQSHNDGHRAHRCLASRIYGRFPQDGVSSGSSGDVVTSGGEEVAASDNEVDMYPSSPPQTATTVPNSPTSMRPWSPPHLPTHAGLPTLPPVPEAAIAAPPALPPSTTPIRASSTMLMLHSLPATIWDRPWSPARPRAMPHISMSELPDIVYDRAQPRITAPVARTSVSKLVISGGPDISGVASAFRERVSLCCESGDFTELLAPKRSFRM